MKKKNAIVIMNFSGVYLPQRFYEEEEALRVDAEGISGTNCYCDKEAMDLLREKIREFPLEGIHFIDSGNYHYMSRIWMERIREPFRLLVFDNHTDMQPPAFGGILSCGGWIASGLTELKELREVILVGPGEEEFTEDFAAWGETEGSVFLFGRERIQEGACDQLPALMRTLDPGLPVYLSIDKDVLCERDACTAWSQGNLTLELLMECLRALGKRAALGGIRVIGVDICGECAANEPYGAAGMEKNERANRVLLEELVHWKLG